MLSDLRFAFRSLVRSPGFTAVAVVTLAIAIGVNTAIFSLVNSLMLRPIVPYKPAEVVNIFTARKEANRDYRLFSYAEFAALRETNPVFNDVAAFTFSLAGIGRDEAMRRSFVFFVSDNFFPLAGVRPAAGRFFSAAESQPNANIPVAVACYAYWQRMGGRPDFIGSTVHVNGQLFTIIGVTPRGYTGVNAMISPEIWLPLGIFSAFSNTLENNGPANDLLRSTNYALYLTGRFNPGVDLQSAGPLLPTLASRLDVLQPSETATTGRRELKLQTPSRFSVGTAPANDDPVTSLAALLFFMAGIVLLIGSLNLANMLLARGTGRAKEIAIRLSLGASRWRVIRQLLVEGFLLALLGGAFGLLLAQWSNDLLAGSLNSAFRAMNFSVAIELNSDVTEIGATVAFCIGATLIFSLGPALKSVRSDLVHDMKHQAGSPASYGRWNRFFSLRHCLIMAQISLSLVLLFSGGLFFRGALNASGLDLGFDPNGCAVAELDYSLAHTPEATARQTISSLLNLVQQQPGVRAAAYSTLIPYGSSINGKDVVPAESAPTTGTTDKQPKVNGIFSGITADYFEALGVHLLQGRKFTPVEVENRNASDVVIIDAAMAKLLFPGSNALGKYIRYTSAPTGKSPTEMEIVGIVSNHRQQPRAGDPRPHLYVPLAKGYSPNAYVTVRFATDDSKSTATAITELRKTFRSFDPDLPVLRLVPFADLINGNIQLWVIKLGAVIFGIFGGIALLLAVVGVYGVKAYAVSQRTHEIGIRMALGALPRNVFSLIMKQGALQITVAMSAGIILSLLIGKVLSSRLFNVSPSDPVVLGSAITFLAASALLACYLPARRATQVDPAEALRSE